METLYLKNSVEKILAINFINIHELFIQSIAKHYKLWFDKTIDPLFQILWSNNKAIYVINSLTDLSGDEVKSELKNIGIRKETISYLFDDLNRPSHMVAAQQGENVVGISGYHLTSMSFFTSFSTLTHELVHYIDQIICGDECVYTRLEALDDGRLEVYSEAADAILKIIEAEKGHIDLFKNDINIADAKANGVEKLPYCVQAYVSAIMSGKPDIAGNISTYIRTMSDILLSLRGKY